VNRSALAGATLCACVASACARSDSPSSSSDSGAITDARADTAATGDTLVDLGTDVASDGIFPTEDTRPDDADAVDDTPPVDTTPPPTDTTPPTCATPAGSTATASGAYASAPGDAIDGNVGTYWNAGDYAGWIDVKFPAAIYFDRVRVAATALPACSEPYTLTGFRAGTPTVIGTATPAVPDGAAWLPTMVVTAGVYDELRIDVGTSSSWIAIAEIVVYDSAGGCGLP
jgi:hypothetical protein